MKKIYIIPCIMVIPIETKNMLAKSFKKSEESGDEMLSRQHSWKDDEEGF